MRTRRGMPSPDVTLAVLLGAAVSVVGLFIALLELFAWAGRHNLFGL